MHVFVYFVTCIISMVMCYPSDTRTSEDIVLNIDKLSQIGDPEKILEVIRNVAGGLHGCGIQVPKMKRVFLSNRSVTCNDGSPAGYYIRKSYGSSRWLVFLEGGWYCFDHSSCQGRWVNTQHYMSSRMWPLQKEGTGILSWHPEDNPYFYNANIVFIPYCSSDTWSGNKRATRNGEFSFLGSVILEEVIKELLDKGLRSASKLILAGSSAGGTGVLLNLDKVAEQVNRVAPNVDVRGIADSGWFLDNTPYTPVRCTSAFNCAPTEGIKKGIIHWNGQTPQSCRERFSEKEQWQCYFGYRIYKSLKTPVFVIQHLFDEAQMTADNVAFPVKPEQWSYIHKVGAELKETLTNVSALFAPACLSHTTLTKRNWQQLSIAGTTLPEAIKCWEGSDKEFNHYKHDKHRHGKHDRHENRDGEDNFISDEPKYGRKNRKRCRGGRRKGKGNKRRCRKRGKRFLEPNSLESIFPAHGNVTDHQKGHHDHHRRHHNNKCNHHLVDHCAWPQCNFSCPKLRHPFTDEEMDFIDLLMQFGLDLSGIANALKIDVATLQTMEHDKLLQMLVEQS